MVAGERYAREARFFVGGRSARAFDVAGSLIDRLMGEFAYAGSISRCASLRFGNCLCVTVYKPGGGGLWV